MTDDDKIRAILGCMYRPVMVVCGIAWMLLVMGAVLFFGAML